MGTYKTLGSTPVAESTGLFNLTPIDPGLSSQQIREAVAASPNNGYVFGSSLFTIGDSVSAVITITFLVGALLIKSKADCNA